MELGLARISIFIGALDGLLFHFKFVKQKSILILILFVCIGFTLSGCSLGIQEQVEHSLTLPFQSLNPVPILGSGPEKSRFESFRNGLNEQFPVHFW